MEETVTREYLESILNNMTEKGYVERVLIEGEDGVKLTPRGLVYEQFNVLNSFDFDSATQEECKQILAHIFNGCAKVLIKTDFNTERFNLILEQEGIIDNAQV